jgi:hypothetical protein
MKKFFMLFWIILSFNVATGWRRRSSYSSIRRRSSYSSISNWSLRRRGYYDSYNDSSYDSYSWSRRRSYYDSYNDSFSSWSRRRSYYDSYNDYYYYSDNRRRSFYNSSQNTKSTAPIWIVVIFMVLFAFTCCIFLAVSCINNRSRSSSTPERTVQPVNNVLNSVKQNRDYMQQNPGYVQPLQQQPVPVIQV